MFALPHQIPIPAEDSKQARPATLINVGLRQAETRKTRRNWTLDSHHLITLPNNIKPHLLPLSRILLAMDQFVLFGDSITQHSFSQQNGFAFGAELSDQYARRLDVIK